MKEGKKKDENEAEKHKEPDYLAHILKNLGFEDATTLEEEACIARGASCDTGSATPPGFLERH